MGIPDPHVTALFAVALVAIVLPGTTRSNVTARARRLLGFGGVFAAINAYWLLPMLVTALSGRSQLSSFTTADLVTFSASGTIGGNVPLSVGMLYGFWRGGVLVTTDLLPFVVVVALFTLLLLVVIYGAVSSNDPFVRGAVGVGVVGFFLALGASTSLTRPLWVVLFEFVPFAGAMRDTQKFSVLLVFAYAVLGAAGVDQLWSDRDSRRLTAGLSLRSPARPSRDHLLAACLVVLVVTGPLVYALPIVGGFWGQVEPVQYPADWHEVNDRLAAGDDQTATATGSPGRILFLPWHQYIRFSWTGRTVVTPADVFFEQPVVRGRTLEVGGIETQVSDPTHRRIDTLLDDRERVTTFGADVAPLGFEYVLLSKEADFRQYGFLDRQSDLTVVYETDEIALYRNEAYDADAGPWPPAGPTVPWPALLAGSVVSLLTAVVAVGSVFGWRLFRLRGRPSEQ
jgi:hypothetical protein